MHAEEILSTVKARHGNHEVTSGVAECEACLLCKPLDFAFVIALTRASISVFDDIVREHGRETVRTLARAISHDLRDKAAVIIIDDRTRHSAKKGKGVDMPV